MFHLLFFFFFYIHIHMLSISIVFISFLGFLPFELVYIVVSIAEHSALVIVSSFKQQLNLAIKFEVKSIRDKLMVGLVRPVSTCTWTPW